jgi:hypothetical protein
MEQNEMLKALGAALAPYMNERQKHDLPAGFSISTNRAHGDNGIFSVAGIDRDIFSTRVTPDGLMRYLPSVGVNDTHPIVGYLTGFTAGNGAAEQETPCADPPRAGRMKSCLQGSAFGRLARATEVIDLSSSGERINRGEMFDLQLVNDPLVANSDMLVPPSVPANARRILASDLVAKMIALGVEFEDVLSHQLWTGSPLNNNVGGGYMEFLGLEGLVTETHTDIITNADCPSLASLIMNAGDARVDQDAGTIFNYMTTMWRVVNQNAKRMNMMPVQWAWVMPEAIFRELTDFWPCVYASYRCNTGSNDVFGNTDALAMRQMSSDMYNGQYLEVDHTRIPVITDDAMSVQYNEDDGSITSGCMRGDIYLLPFVVKGGTRVLYMEYFNFAGPGAAMELANEGRVSNLVWSDGGKWLWTPRQTLYCFDWTALTRMRLRLLTPHLAARLENIVVCPLKFARQPFRSDPYFLNGGNTSVSQGLPYSFSEVDVRD